MRKIIQAQTSPHWTSTLAHRREAVWMWQMRKKILSLRYSYHLFYLLKARQKCYIKKIYWKSNAAIELQYCDDKPLPPRYAGVEGSNPLKSTALLTIRYRFNIFARGCVALALSCGGAPQTRYTLRRNTACVMNGLAFGDDSLEFSTTVPFSVLRRFW